MLVFKEAEEPHCKKKNFVCLESPEPQENKEEKDWKKNNKNNQTEMTPIHRSTLKKQQQKNYFLKSLFKPVAWTGHIYSERKSLFVSWHTLSG